MFLTTKRQEAGLWLVSFLISQERLQGHMKHNTHRHNNAVHNKHITQMRYSQDEAWLK